jgi:TorA maturation chaperone TorD
MIPIYFDELAEILKACTRLRADECSPAELRRLMADHLTQTNRELAERVLAFDKPELLALSAFVLQAQALIGMSGGGRSPASRGAS